MISENDYLKALQIIDEYKIQQILKKEKFDGDLDLLQVLSGWALNCIESHNERCVEDEDQIIYISDVIYNIKKYGCYKGKGKHKNKLYSIFLMSIRNFGHKCHDEVMKYVEPYIKDMQKYIKPNKHYYK